MISLGAGAKITRHSKHFFTPNHIGKKGKTDRPEKDETKYYGDRQAPFPFLSNQSSARPNQLWRGAYSSVAAVFILYSPDYVDAIHIIRYGDGCFSLQQGWESFLYFFIEPLKPSFSSAFNVRKALDH